MGIFSFFKKKNKSEPDGLLDMDFSERVDRVEKGGEPFTEDEWNVAEKIGTFETLQVYDKKTKETEVYYKEEWTEKTPFWVSRAQDAYNWGLIKIFNEKTGERKSFYVRRKKGTSKEEFYKNFDDRMEELEDKVIKKIIKNN